MVFVDGSGAEHRVSADHLDPGVAIVGTMDLPLPVRSRDGGYRNSVSQRLRAWVPSPDFVIREHEPGSRDGVGGCPQLADHLRWVRRFQRADKEVRRLQRRVRRNNEGLVTMFRAILRLLGDWGYVSGWKLSDKGSQLRFIYNELDLLLVESVSRGLCDGLDGAHLAALTSLFTYEARRTEGEEAAPPEGISGRVEQIEKLAEELISAEATAGVPESRLPDAGFAAIAYAWAAGHDLEELFDDDLAAGDFVRNCRQLIDVLRQLRDGFPTLRAAAAEGIAAIDRGVVAAGGRA